MFYENVNIIGLSNLDAPHRLSSAELQAPLQANLARFNMRPNLIESLTGIEARRIWDPGHTPSLYATQVGMRALEDARLPKEKVGLLINCSISKDFLEPSVASLVHSNLGLSEECMNFDVSNACLGFINGMLIAGNMIERGQVDYALLVACEDSREITYATQERLSDPNISSEDFRARFATLTLGSAACGMVMTRKDLHPEGHEFKGGVLLAATQHAHLCVGHHLDMQTDAKGLLMAGMELSTKTYRKACEVADWDKKEFTQFIMHQVGGAHLRSMTQAIGAPDEKVPRVYVEYGNTGSTTIPLALYKSVESGQIQKGDRVALMGIGSGINSAMMEVIW